LFLCGGLKRAWGKGQEASSKQRGAGLELYTMRWNVVERADKNEGVNRGGKKFCY